MNDSTDNPTPSGYAKLTLGPMHPDMAKKVRDFYNQLVKESIGGGPKPPRHPDGCDPIGDIPDTREEACGAGPW